MDRRTLLKGAVALGLAASPAGYVKLSNRLALHRLRSELPRVEQPLRIGLITDFHVPNYTFPLPWLHSLVKRCACDLLLICGDTVDQPGNEKRIGERFAPMTAPLGVFATLGNHEHWCHADLDSIAWHYREAGVRLLVNEAVEVGGVRLVGLDDMLGGRPRYGLCAGDGPTVVMSHCPASIDEIGPHLHGGLVLSGHTHGGQIAPFGVVIHKPGGSGPYLKGKYAVGDNTLIVSQGLGCVGLPLRIGVRPAFVVVEVG